MAGCGVNHDGAGDKGAAEGRVLAWVAGVAAAIGVAGFASVAAAGVAGGWAALLAVAVILVSALAGAVVGFFVGFAVNWFDRLFVQNPSEITLVGCVLCAGKNTGFPPWHDNDWTFNLGGPSLALAGPTIAGLDLNEIRTRGAPGGGPAFTVIDPASGNQAVHCEISSHIGDYAAVGGAIGSVAGLVAGAVIGAIICAAIGLATFGIGALLCLLVVAIAMLVGAALGGLAGDAIGALAGLIADEIDGFDERGEAVTQGCLMNFTGRWITDSSHQWNEIHDIASVQLIECNDCDEDGAIGSSSDGLIAAVGIGRHPTGRDP